MNNRIPFTALPQVKVKVKAASQPCAPNLSKYFGMICITNESNDSSAFSSFLDLKAFLVYVVWCLAAVVVVVQLSQYTMCHVPGYYSHAYLVGRLGRIRAGIL